MSKTAKLETVWTYSLDYGTAENPTRSGMSGGQDTLGETIRDMFKSVAFYLGRGYEVRGKITEHCKLCAGVGKVPKKGRRPRLFPEMKPCPACKGQKPSETIECGRFELGRDVEIKIRGD